MPSEVREITDLVTDYVKFWTSRELGKLQRDRTPICSTTGTGYKIGNYNLIVNKNKTCEVRDHYDEYIHLFESKVSAVLYAIYTIKNRIASAEEILRIDQEINKHYVDVQAMSRSQERARAKKDYETVDIRQARLELAQQNLEEARNKISKIHRHAKYYKVWE